MRAIVILLALTAAAHADAWYEGEHGTNRIVHLSITAVGGIAYPLTGGVEDNLAADACRWCDPTGLDRATRDALRWSDTGTARTLSDLGAYGAAPALATGLVLAGTLCPPRSWARVIDDFVPVLESMVVAAWVTRVIKLSAGRERPYAHYGTPDGPESFLSFPSGHTSRAFSIVVSAAVIARARGYASEPYLWIGGLALASATGYLRIAADKHYLTDVLVGGALGAAVGLTVPLLMKRAPIVPMRDGIAFVHVW
jgi:membrane-associated phospholipid phosphatase